MWVMGQERWPISISEQLYIIQKMNAFYFTAACTVPKLTYRPASPAQITDIINNRIYVVYYDNNDTPFC